MQKFDGKKPKVVLPSNVFREGTEYQRHTIAFFLSMGGIGDYICHMPALEWIAAENPHVDPMLFVNPPFTDVAREILKPYPRFKVYDREDITKVWKKVKPDYLVDPGKWERYICATGAHLLDLGFMFYAQVDKPPPEYNRMPDLSHLEIEDEKVKRALSGTDYVVFTPGFTSYVRKMKGPYLDELINYVRGKGLTPVLLGKTEFSKYAANGYVAKYDEFETKRFCIDLRDQTTLLDSIAVMNKAMMVIGVDNGLLHLAGCTKTPIIFGHTITDVRHRNIRRPVGLTINIEVPKKVLSCIGCQSNMRFMFGHKFSRCIYGDKNAACLDLLFANNCETWKAAIDHVLKNQK
jgi:ADP-heptose:LPS heptosyltransferase